MYNALKKLISKKYYKDIDLALSKVNIFSNNNKLTAEQQEELLNLINLVYVNSEEDEEE